jgi:hypothetical protein
MPSEILNGIGVPALQLGAKLSVEAIPRLFEWEALGKPGYAKAYINKQQEES